MAVKDILREILINLRLDLTKNLEYDRLTRVILKKFISKDHNCIDVGCHKGEILDLILTYSSEGKHYAFEPIPYLFENLKAKYDNKVTLYPYALSYHSGSTTFQLVKNAPAYSGIKKRKYNIKNPEIEEIKVALKTLDELIPSEEKIHFIKIDVEGGEFGVLKGAQKLLERNKPIILFECGKGASDYYGTQPEDIHSFLKDQIGLEVFTLKSFINSKSSLSAEEFTKHFNTNDEYYFVAAPIK
ncbi:MAG TPA: FkbM family methyltransferase [Brumimicrobium sp.]|nr:FkbM family methyltransferase [Brumimicrobium sp.]